MKKEIYTAEDLEKAHATGYIEGLRDGKIRVESKSKDRINSEKEYKVELTLNLLRELLKHI